MLTDFYLVLFYFLGVSAIEFIKLKVLVNYPNSCLAQEVQNQFLILENLHLQLLLSQICTTAQPDLINKNPAYWRHQISQSLQIVAPIFLFPLASKKELTAFFCGGVCSIWNTSLFLGLNARARDAPHQSMGEGRSAPVHKKTCMGRGHINIYIYIFMDIKTTRPSWPIMQF